MNMRFIATILILGLATYCNQKGTIDSTRKNDSLLVELKYGKIFWSNYFQPKTLSLGATLVLKIVNDSSYLLQWGDSLNLRTFPDTFNLDGHESWIPKFIDENEDYIVVRKGCGNPCWIGYFLPINDSIKPTSIFEYLDYDLESDLVAYIKDKNIEIVNLRSGQTEVHGTKDCISSFIDYCIDSLSIKNRILSYKWIPETKINSGKGKWKTEKIKL
jgi:hypothetical protein